MADAQSFFASCPKGVEDLLATELSELGADKIQAVWSGVNFEGDLKTAYRVCLWSRLASRVMLPLKSFAVTNEDELYREVQSINWGKHVKMDGTLAVNCNVSHSGITNSHYASLKVKDAIVDQFKEVYDQRPSVDRERPDIRINLHINKDQAVLSLDLSGEPLHKRGYRQTSMAAPLKENLAAAILKRAGWPNDSLSLVDLMCGSGTLLTEAAHMALGLAPGLHREFYGFLGWKGHDAEAWQALVQEASQQRVNDRAYHHLDIRGFDASIKSVKAARQNVQAADVDRYVKIEQRAIEDCPLPENMEKGMVVVNPPYGERLGDAKELVYVYADLGECLRQNYAEWSAYVFTGNEELAKHVGLRSHKSNTLFNGAIKCKLFHYTLRKAQSEQVKAILEEKDQEARQMIINRLQKNHKHLSRWAKRNNIECYRVYDADLPEFSAAIDIYNDQVLVQEYQAPSSIDIRKARLRFNFILQAVEQVLGVSKQQIVVKTRQQQKGLSQYEKQADEGHEKIVHESGLIFIVNLQDYLDTGLFLDHRDTRQKIREWAKDKHFLNLFAYTGSVSVYAAAGGAASTTTIDMSNTYLRWAQKNFKINQIVIDNKHQFIKADCVKWLVQQSKNPDQRYDLIFLDPPTFSNSKSMDDVFDVQKDHVFLIQAAMKLLNENGQLLFSNNFRKFKLYSDKLTGLKIENITQLTMPEDFRRNSKIHQCWLIEKAD